ncbi:MAG TPA: serine acetyltransferase, partial [Sutterella sp.]|nr:serine acetyltransferase [Sutterella sp.]
MTKTTPKSGLRALDRLSASLASAESLAPVLTEKHAIIPLPSRATLATIIEELKSVLFPGYFGNATFNRQSLAEDISSKLQKIQALLAGEVYRGMAFSCAGETYDPAALRQVAYDKTYAFTDTLPQIRAALYTDAQAAYEGDPAATSIG